MSATATMDLMEPLALTASDVNGQRRISVRNVAAKATVGELVRSLIPRLGLIREDAQGRPLTYRARLEREGRTLNGTEMVGDALKTDDRISLYPHIQAGACFATVRGCPRRH